MFTSIRCTNISISLNYASQQGAYLDERSHGWKAKIEVLPSDKKFFDIQLHKVRTYPDSLPLLQEPEISEYLFDGKSYIIQ